ncbi:MAG: DNA translocase FtsK 4TM domain-containing protein, partial [Amylibacter sp.]
MQAAIKKRGSELIGIAMLSVGLLFTLIMWSYSPDDPNRFNVTSDPAQNMLGEFGAAIAGTLTLAIGKAAWVIPVFSITWGIRFVLHIGDTRAATRAIFLPVFIAITAIFLEAHIPEASWDYSFGWGGLFGYTALGFLVNLNPLSLTLGVAIITLILGILFVSLGLFVFGYTILELRVTGRYAVIAVILSYASLVNAFSEIVGRIQNYRIKSVAKAEAAKTAASIGHVSPAMPEQNAKADTTAQKPAIKLSIPSLPNFGLGKRQQAATTEPFVHIEPQLESTPEERVRRRISEAIKNKIVSVQADENASARVEPVLSQPSSKQLQQGDSDIDDNLIDDHDLGFNDTVENIFSIPTIEPKQVVQHRTPKPVQKSKKAKAEAQPSLFNEANAAYETPPLSMLSSATTVVRHHLSDEALEQNARLLENVLDDYGVKGEIVAVRPGPVVTMYELEPAPGLKASRVIGLADDIARSMSALSA